MNTAKTCNLTSNDHYSAILSDCRAAMEGLRAPEDAIREYLDRVVGVLDDLVKHCGDGVEVRYNVSTRFKKAFLKIEAQGDKFDPAISGVGGVALFIVAMVVAFIVLGYLIFAIDKALGRIANRR